RVPRAPESSRVDSKPSSLAKGVPPGRADTDPPAFPAAAGTSPSQTPDRRADAFLSSCHGAATATCCGPLPNWQRQISLIHPPVEDTPSPFRWQSLTSNNSRFENLYSLAQRPQLAEGFVCLGLPARSRV